jgi:hypothetical protein
MKKTALILAVFVCFMSYQGFAEGKIPVTPDIVEALLNKGDSSFDGLIFYLSKSFTMKIYEQNETKGIEIIDKRVIINQPNSDNGREIDFPDNSEGVWIDRADRGREIKIYFKKQDKTLVFSKRQNSYDLSSVIMKDKRSYITNPSEPIRLCVAGENKLPTEVRVVSTDFAYSDNKLSSDYNYVSYQNTGNYNANYNSSASPSRRIMGNGSVSPVRVKEYVRTKKSLTNRDIAIIDKYFEEARFEGVNVDIAIAQMLYWTNNLRNNERVNTCNYGDLSRIDNVFNGRFDDKGGMTIGVRAHIQHLKAYAKEVPNRGIVDPRFGLAYNRGFHGITFEQVYRSWSANPRYRQEIDNILFDLYR